ncbi:hypothetical protein OJAV_G00112990 [Oryzias javanicus]|uniref:Uncharacterized protein n=1 Tax=Oryzias javanicus TaxID=123683 RepID=A0A437CWI0_ORYJA|nr:hypothetical protein OJAV_G00112990 [Oryzias javanicus]
MCARFHRGEEEEEEGGGEGARFGAQLESNPRRQLREGAPGIGRWSVYERRRERSAVAPERTEPKPRSLRSASPLREFQRNKRRHLLIFEA